MEARSGAADCPPPPARLANLFTPSAFALVVKRTYEYVRLVLHRASPAIISGGILNSYPSEEYYAGIKNAQAFKDYAAPR